MIDYLKASDDVQEVYTRHLALLVCDCGGEYVRLTSVITIENSSDAWLMYIHQSKLTFHLVFIL